MQVWHSLAEAQEGAAGLGRTAVTFGTFDGVHRGHRVVLDALVAAGLKRGLPAVAVTFDRHPLSLLRPAAAPVPLITSSRRVELLGEAGVAAVLVLPFTTELAAVEPGIFVEEWLFGALRAALVVVGDDARYGRASRGDLALLREIGERRGVEVVGLDAAQGNVVAPATRRWSSTWAREAVAVGEVGQAAAVLGRPHRVTGTVVHGDHRGRELGYPTANLSGIEEAVPADGVYAGWMLRQGAGPGLAPGQALSDRDRMLPAAVSIGTNPTFDGVDQRVEAYVLGRTDLDLYGEQVALDLVERLRPTLRFESVEDLVHQMGLDTTRCAMILGAGNLTLP